MDTLPPERNPVEPLNKTLLPWATFMNRCRAVRENDGSSPYWGRCELRRHNHSIDHALERGMLIPRWSTRWTVWSSPVPSKWIQDRCVCDRINITSSEWSHAVDCPFYDL